jgi:hypothetical protein
MWIHSQIAKYVTGFHSKPQILVVQPNFEDWNCGIRIGANLAKYVVVSPCGQSAGFVEEIERRKELIVQGGEKAETHRLDTRCPWAGEMMRIKSIKEP